ncbi:hypothetical protein DFH09DRAFT_1312873 [Mycena vulgaris]|nr:hypothetical protein DFH09DRAFT_1312873 [Mycena vulgaris]
MHNLVRVLSVVSIIGYALLTSDRPQLIAVHTTDGVPTIIPQIDGYQHHGVEFWNFLDPSAAITTKSCAASGEDLTCSDSILSEGIDLAHLTYFSIPASTAFCT